MTTAQESQEIIIIKRGGDHDDGHHGGAWKIAFADFMTAMMALFLVLWLINAANEETKKSVASYFNPVKLVDRNRSEKGLDEMSGGPVEISEPAEVEAAATAKPDERDTSEKPTDEELSRRPYEVLEKIVAAAADTGSGGLGVVSDDQSENRDGGGIPYRDPFAPDFWNNEANNADQMSGAVSDPEAPKPDASAKTAAIGQIDAEDASVANVEDMDESDGAPSKPHDRSQDLTQTKEERRSIIRRNEEAGVDVPSKETDQNRSAALNTEMVALNDTSKADPEIAPAEEPAEENEAGNEALRQTLSDIEKAFAAIFGEQAPVARGLSVTTVNEGVMISITDQLDRSMFEIGSAVPKRDLVVAMEKISKVLSDRRGDIRVYGHTDSRPFANGEYGNWQLSTARAQSAYFMLVRGGLPENRISQIAGFADRNLKIKANPLAAKNRRIEILLEVP